MNCDKIEEHLTDFMEDDIDPALREKVKNHLESCSLCSRKLEDYITIDKLLDEEIRLQPSPLTLSRLSRIAREKVKKDRTPLWRRWSYSPVLVPLLGSALALLVWVSYPKKDTDYSRVDTVYSRNAIAKKAPLPEGRGLFESGEGTLDDLESKTERLLSRGSSSDSPEAFIGEKESANEVAQSTAEPPVSARATGKKSSTLDIIKSDKPLAESRDDLTLSSVKQEAREESFGRAEGLSTERQSEHEQPAFRKNDDKNREAGSVSFRDSAYDKRLNLALRQQSTGNCDASIQTNIDLITTTPPPRDEVKERAYLSLAECYEQRGDWENALFNYQILQWVSPNRASLVNDKIETLRKQIKLIKSKQHHPPSLPSK